MVKKLCWGQWTLVLVPLVSSCCWIPSSFLHTRAQERQQNCPLHKANLQWSSRFWFNVKTQILLQWWYDMKSCPCWQAFRDSIPLASKNFATSPVPYRNWNIRNAQQRAAWQRTLQSLHWHIKFVLPHVKQCNTSETERYAVICDMWYGGRVLGGRTMERRMNWRPSPSHLGKQCQGKENQNTKDEKIPNGLIKFLPQGLKS